ncbi:unnamed protein product [Agarophyton chilense]
MNVLNVHRPILDIIALHRQTLGPSGTSFYLLYPLNPIASGIMKVFAFFTFISLVSLCSAPTRACAGVLVKHGDGYKLIQTNRRVFKPSNVIDSNSPDRAKLVKAKKVWPATIEFSAFGVATLYINGIIYSKLFSPHPWKMSVDLARGDVVSIKAEKTGVYAGVMVTIRWKGRKIRSGRNVFKVRSDSYYSWEPEEQDYWNRPLRDSNGIIRPLAAFCSWKDADIVHIKNLSFDKRAKFIWSLHTTHNDDEEIKTPAQTVYIRHVMGGQMCGNDSQEKKINNKKNKGDTGGEKKNKEEKKNLKNSGGEHHDGATPGQAKSSEEKNQDSLNAGVGGSI